MTTNSAEALVVSSTPDYLKLRAKAENLARDLTLSYTQIPPEKGLFLFLEDNGLSLCQLTGKKQRLQRLIYVDFLQGKHGYRRIHDCTIKQPLARAVGIKSGIRPKIFDATAGLGTDAFVLATLGCEVLLHERNPIVAALLADGLHRAKNSNEINTIIARMVFSSEDSEKTLVETNCDTIYLDPMYPHTDSTAEKKIEMKSLRRLTGDDTDAFQLMHLAEKSRAQRIVVKRPRLAPKISDRKPHTVVQGKSCRYDIYFPENFKKNTICDISPRP